MSVPGFTAEKSLGAPTKQYRTIAVPLSGGHSLAPQQFEDDGVSSAGSDEDTLVEDENQGSADMDAGEQDISTEET